MNEITKKKIKIKNKYEKQQSYEMYVELMSSTYIAHYQVYFGFKQFWLLLVKLFFFVL